MNVDAENASPSPYYGGGEPSTFMRFFGVLSSTVEGRFSFNITQTLIMLSSQWIAEGSTQQDIHERYSSSTNIIMAAIGPLVDEYEGEDAEEVMKEYLGIENEMNSCDIVEVDISANPNPKDMTEFKVRTKVSQCEMETARDGTSTMVCRTKLNDIDSMVICKRENYNDGVLCATENGYRRVNCTARRTYYRALKLAFKIGYLGAERPLEVEGLGPKPEDYSIDRRMGGERNVRRV